MAALSDQLLVVTILAYLAAMMGYAAEYAFGVRGVVARVATRDLVPVAAAASSSSSEVLGQPTPASNLARSTDAGGTGPRPGVAWFGRAALGLTVLGAAAHAGVLVTRALAAGRVPWGNMYEFVVAVCFVGLLAWLALVVWRPGVRPLGLFVTLVEVVLLGIAGMSLYTAAGPLVPALHSYWLAIHVSAAATASGLFLVGFVCAALYLLRGRFESGRTDFPYSLAARAPAAETLERVAFRVHAFAFPIWTLAVICGAIWAESAWGRYWAWDPKETWSFIAWVIYAGYLHARATPSVRRTTATWLAIVGWATMLVNLFGVNLVISGLHSYAGVN